MDQIHGAEMNPIIQVEAARQAGVFSRKDKMKRVEEAGSAWDDAMGPEVGEKLDIIRQTHVGILRRENSGVSSGNVEGKGVESKHTREKKVKKVTGKPGEKAGKKERLDNSKKDIIERAQESELRNIDNLKKAALSRKKGNDSGKTDPINVVKEFLAAKSGNYRTRQGYDLYVFRDPQSGRSYFTLSIPLPTGDIEQISVLAAPENPGKPQVFLKKIIPPEALS